MVSLTGTSVNVGIAFKYTSTTPLSQAFSVSRTALRYTLSNSNKTITTNAAGNGTASNNKITKYREILF
jgi:hypothetical protein